MAFRGLTWLLHSSFLLSSPIKASMNTHYCSKMAKEEPFLNGRNRHKSKGLGMGKWEEKVREERRDMNEWAMLWMISQGGFYSWMWKLKFTKNSSQRATPWPAIYVAKLMASTLLNMAWGKSIKPPIVEGLNGTLTCIQGLLCKLY